MQLISNARNLLARSSVFIILARGLNDRVSFFAQTVNAIVFKYHMSVTFRHYSWGYTIRYIKQKADQIYEKKKEK